MLSDGSQAPLNVTGEIWVKALITSHTTGIILMRQKKQFKMDGLKQAILQLKMRTTFIGSPTD